MKTAFWGLLLASTLIAEDPDVERLVAALGDEDPQVVAEAQRDLLIQGPEALPILRRAVEAELARLEALCPRIPLLVQELDSDAVATRDEAEEGLVDAGPAALPALRETVLKGSVEARARAKRAIGQIRSGKGPTLTRLVRLAEAIGAQADDTCVPDLLALAGRTAAPDSSAAIDGLWRLATPAAREALHVLATDADVGRRWSARAALIELGETPPGGLEDFLKEWPPAPLRKRVATALDVSELPEVVPVAMAAWEKEEDDKLSEQFYYLLVASADRDALTTCALRALDTFPPEKRCLLPGLIRRRTPESEKAVLALIADTDEETREAAAARFLPLLGDDALPHLLALLKDPADAMLRRVLPALDAAVGRDPAPFLEALRDRHAPGALEAALVRSEGADEARRIPERWGSLSPEDHAVLEWLAKPLLDPSFPKRLSSSSSGEFNYGTSTVRFAALRALAGSPAPDPRRHSLPFDAFADPYRRLRRLEPDGRREALRAPLGDPDRNTQLSALRAAILLDVDGLEEDVLPLLSFEVNGGPDEQIQETACGYLATRKTPDLLDRVRRIAQGDMPGAAAALWVAWEGRPATEALLERLKGKTPPLGVLQALTEAPLRPEDVAVLLGGGRPDEKWLEEPRRWTEALMRTGSPEALREATDIILLEEKSKYATTEAYAALLRDARPLALRLARAEMRPAQEYAWAGWARALAEVPCPEASDMLIRLLDAAPANAEWFAKALAQGDPASARMAVAARRSSRHIAKRLEALWIDLYLGQSPTAEELEPLTDCIRYTCDSGIRALIMLAEPRDLYPLVPLLCDPDPEIRRAAFWLLEVSTAHTLDEMRNDLFIPCEARAAWKGWLDAHADATRSDLLDQALRDADYGTGVEARIRACAEGPWYLAAAAMLADGQPYWGWYTFDQCQSFAVRWKISERSK